MGCVVRYDRKVVIQNLTGTVDAHGFQDETLDTNWVTYETAYCSVESKGGREFWKNQQVTADVSHIWRCQWSKKLALATPDMRLLHEGSVYEIISIEDVDLAHYEIEIRTKKAV
jgi:head-tail adaptor